MTTLAELLVADSAQAWRSAGFQVDPDGVCRIGQVGIRLVGPEAGRGIVGWVLRDLPEAVGDLAGVPTQRTDSAPVNAAVHPNGVTEIDHVVLLSPDLPNTVAAFVVAGVEPRRERDGEMGGQPIRQVFFKFGTVVIEVVGSPTTTTEGPATLWGVTYVAQDIEAAAAYFGERTSPVKDAVQPGRRITTLRHREFSMSVRTALISPYVRAADR